MTEPCRSRAAWPAPSSTKGVERRKTVQVPTSLMQRVRVLTWSVVVLSVCLLVIAASFLLIFVDRGKLRAEEDARIRQEIRNSWCTALDALPEGGRLDRLRDAYDCGPGIPFEELTPQEQQQIRGGLSAPTPHAQPPGPRRPTNTFRPPPTPSN